MEKDSGKALQRLAVDGGMSNSALCMQVGPSKSISPLSLLIMKFRPNVI